MATLCLLCKNPQAPWSPTHHLLHSLQVDRLPILPVHPAAADEAVALLASFDPREWDDTSYVAAAPPQQHSLPHPVGSSMGWAANTGVFGDRLHPML